MPQPIDYKDCHKRLTHGIPLSLEEQRQLCEQVTGYPIPRKKRCVTCECSGKVETASSGPLHWGGISYSVVTVTCPDCRGSGYVPEESSVS